MACKDCEKNAQIVKHLQEWVDDMTATDTRIIFEIYSKYISSLDASSQKLQKGSEP